MAENVKEMRSTVMMNEVTEFIRLARNQESIHDQFANDLEHALDSEYLNISVKNEMKAAANKERDLARKWNALWAVFTQAEFYNV